jgi:dTMP kinase
MNSVTEVLLFSAARSQLIKERVEPALEQGEVVILDRFFDSTTAYQGFGREDINPGDIQQLNRMASHQLTPNITFYLQLTLEEARARQDEQRDRMEQADDAFYNRVIDGFNTLATSEDRFVTLDATLPKRAVHEQVWRAVQNRWRT